MNFSLKKQRTICLNHFAASFFTEQMPVKLRKSRRHFLTYSPAQQMLFDARRTHGTVLKLLFTTTPSLNVQRKLAVRRHMAQMKAVRLFSTSVAPIPLKPILNCLEFFHMLKTPFHQVYH